MKNSKKSVKKTYQYGVYHEELAVVDLEKKGYEILETRYKTKYGEIDIIAKKDDLVAFVEVKSRKNPELIENIIKSNQIKRIKEAALDFIANHQEYNDYNFRFDLALYIEHGQDEYFEDYF